MEGKPVLPVPAGFADTVVALHLVAERVIAPARKPENEIALEPTPGGFGTPAFEFGGTRRRVRVEGPELVYEEDGSERRAPLRSLAAAGALVADLLPAGTELSDEPLDVDPDAAQALGRWYAFGAAALGRLLDGADPEDDPTPARLWPEHFDLAIDLGSEGQGARATYGFSPGDEVHPEPYLYVGPWSSRSGELWQASGFDGAELGYVELLAAVDQGAAASDFFETRRNALNEMGRSPA
jgi:hypothetical protein